MTKEGGFFWYELVTSDATAAADFYAGVVGWTMADSSAPGMRYTLASVGDRQVAGLMDFPPDMPKGHPVWLGYVLTADVDGTAEKVKQAGGTIHREPGDIPGIGRFAVAADPQGATFMLLRGDSDPAPELDMSTPGAIGWHELHARDWEKAFDFYSDLFGWQKADAIDMGRMGTYQTFATGSGQQGGGMMNSPQTPNPFWLFYFFTDDIDAAAQRVTDNGGRLMHGPMEVPGPLWVIQALDPQGAMFAMVGHRRR